jgi:6-phosphogluconolactonase
MSRTARLRRRAVFGGTLAGAFALLAIAAGNATAHGSGAVYTLTNDTAENAVKVFERGKDGALNPVQEVGTGGTGTGAGLGNQGALALDHRRLFAVNPGSNTITSLRVAHDGLQVVDAVGSGGTLPISLTVHGRILYVLNAGGVENITGFHVSRKGFLSPIAGSTRPLSGAGVGPAQVSFDHDGDRLVVTEKETNLIDTYTVGGDGRAFGPQTSPSSGATPFGFAFASRDRLIVSEAFGGAVDQSALSSYRFEHGALTPVTESLGTTETAACWVAVTGDSRYAYTTNTGSASVSGYRVGRNGELTLLDADGKTGDTDAGPIDVVVTGESRYLYVLNTGSDTITGFHIDRDGSLERLPSTVGSPHGATGLAGE